MEKVSATFMIPESFIKQIKKEVYQEIKEDLNELLRQDEILDMNGLMELLGIKKSMAYKIVGETDIPYRMMGKKKQFMRGEVLNWYKKQKYIQGTTFDGLEK